MSLYFTNTYERSFGTFPLKGEELSDALLAAVEVGYRSIDTAQMYQNEADVGEALRSVSVPREQLLVTTKVHPDNFSEEKFLPSVEKSLRDLGLERIDVLLLHWPPIGEDVRASLALLQKAKRQGLTRHIGVSNYTARLMRMAVSLCDEPLVTNQVEFHPLLNQAALLDAAAETGIPLASFSSVARGEVFRYPIFEEIGRSYGKTPAQVALRWTLQQGVSINVMSRKKENLRANFDVMDFVLSSVDMAKISRLTSAGVRVVDVDKVPWAPKWD